MAGDIEQRRQELTRAELEIMQILWSLGKGFVNDVLAVMPEPKPAYNTVSTIIRILEKKGFVAHNSYGKSHEYYPLVDKDSYTGCFMNSVLNNFTFFTKKTCIFPRGVVQWYGKPNRRGDPVCDLSVPTPRSISI